MVCRLLKKSERHQIGAQQGAEGMLMSKQWGIVGVAVARQRYSAADACDVLR
jgi:hypothetical protein